MQTKLLWSRFHAAKWIMPLCFVWSLFFFSGTGLHSRVSTMYAWWFNYMCSTTLINCYLTSFNLFWGAKGHLRYSSKVTTYSNISNQSPQFLVCTQKDYCCCWVLLRPILDALNFILKRCTDNISTLDLAKQKEKKTHTHTEKQQQQLPSNYCEGQFIKQPLQISKMFLRLHQHMFYIFYLA